MKLNLAYSTCPNDTFMFEAIANHRITTDNIDFSIEMADIEELNKRAFQSQADITKLSFHAYLKVAGQYQILSAGSALGDDNGPLLISKKKIYPDEIKDVSIAVPGINTTANLLLNIAYPDAGNKKEYLFSDIEAAVLSEETDAGLIIHENRFTYQSKGLQKIIDLGEYWHENTGMLIPLGGIVIKRNLPEKLKADVQRLIRDSILFALHDPGLSYPYVKKYAQEMDDEVMYNHIQLYVNDFSVDLGEHGKASVQALYKQAFQKKIIDQMPKDIFLDDRV